MQRDMGQLIGKTFDVLVCGGGIYGAWTAYDAVLRGLKVAIVDQGDWACGTSSASSKLIHGGLRYLESFDFKLVRKTLAERQMLLNTAPHRVMPLRFGIPVYRDSRIGSIRLTLGLVLYDWLATVVPQQCRYKRYTAGEFIRRFPFLNADELKAGFTYFDAQTDDARFVLELISGACAYRAVCVNYCKVTGLVEKDGKVVGAYIQDQVTGVTGVMYASQIVNTSGRWSSGLQKKSLDYRLSKGIHIILPQTVMTEALLLTAKSDGRVFFIIPWYGMTLVGTTDDNYNGDIDRVSVESKDISYLLTEVNRIFKDVKWDEEDIVGYYAGLRVLKQSAKESPSSISRDWDIIISNNGMLTSIGGKFTSARADAELIVDRICLNLGLSRKGHTFGKPFPWLPEGDYREWEKNQLEMASGFGIDNDCAKYLICRHGNRVQEIFRLCQNEPNLARRIRPELPFIFADLVFCARNEMVVHLEDLLRRRLPLLILAKLKASELRQLAQMAAIELNWDDEKMNREIDTCVQQGLGL